MKKYISLLILVTTLQNLNAAEVRCISSFDGENVDLLSEQHSGCLADLAWGFDNVCFTGDAEDILYYINDKEFFVSNSYAITDASLLDQDTITFTGYDKRNFWSDIRKLARCSN